MPSVVYSDWILFFKTLHIIAVTTWMAGLFYLPRLFVYHAEAIQLQDTIGCTRFCTMERRLYWAIMWPSLWVSLLMGVLLIQAYGGGFWRAGWMHAKLGLVTGLVVFHHACGYYRKQLAQTHSVQRTGRFFRIFNEIPTLLFVGIVYYVVYKPI